MSTVRWDTQLYLPRRSATVVVYDGVKTGRLLTSVTSLERNDVTRRRHTQAGGRVESRSKLTHDLVRVILIFVTHHHGLCSLLCHQRCPRRCRQPPVLCSGPAW